MRKLRKPKPVESLLSFRYVFKVFFKIFIRREYRYNEKGFKVNIKIPINSIKKVNFTLEYYKNINYLKRRKKNVTFALCTN